MRYPACEKLEIIRLVEQSHLPVRRTLDKIGIPRDTFYRWYDLYRCGGPEALEDRRPGPDRAWNRIPKEVQQKLVDLALEELEPAERVPYCNRLREASPAGKGRHYGPWVGELLPVNGKPK